MQKSWYLLLIPLLFIFSCDDTITPPPITGKLILKFKFDPDQIRLDNFGNISLIPLGNAAQTPKFNLMAAHYIELTEGALVQVGDGEVLYKSQETTDGGDLAIDFEQLVVVEEGWPFYQIPLSDVTPGDYEFLRVSLAYQNYDIDFRIDLAGNPLDLTGTIASFIGYNSFIETYTIHTEDDVVNANKLQGYWAFETHASGLVPTTVSRGQAPGTTVVNPISGTSPIPAGSCLVTGSFDQPLTITGTETEDIVVTVSLSVNNSFEWTDDGDGFFEPANGEVVVDMGIRGLIPIVE